VWKHRNELIDMVKRFRSKEVPVVRNPQTCRFCGAVYYGPYYGPLVWCPKCGRRQDTGKIVKSPQRKLSASEIHELRPKMPFGMNPKRFIDSSKASEGMERSEREREINRWLKEIKTVEPYERVKVLERLYRETKKYPEMVGIFREVVIRGNFLIELDELKKRLEGPFRRGTTRKGVNPLSLYQSFHGNPPAKTRMVNLPVPKKGQKLVKVGRLTHVIYSPEWPSRHSGSHYEHAFGDTGTRMLPDKPILATDEKGEHLFIIPDRAKPRFTNRGIIA
jgi:uncharacterized Zn finger protein (UPF0148 family)